MSYTSPILVLDGAGLDGASVLLSTGSGGASGSPSSMNGIRDLTLSPADRALREVSGILGTVSFRWGGQYYSDLNIFLGVTGRAALEVPRRSAVQMDVPAEAEGVGRDGIEFVPISPDDLDKLTSAVLDTLQRDHGVDFA